MTTEYSKIYRTKLADSVIELILTHKLVHTNDHITFHAKCNAPSIENKLTLNQIVQLNWRWSIISRSAMPAAHTTSLFCQIFFIYIITTCLLSNSGKILRMSTKCPAWGWVCMQRLINISENQACHGHQRHIVVTRMSPECES